MAHPNRASISLAGALTLGLLVLLAAAVAPSRALALPPPVSGSGCTVSWVNNEGALSCFTQGEDDVRNGAAHPHYVACTAKGTVYCCVDNDAGFQDCEVEENTSRSTEAQRLQAILGAHRALTMSLGRYTNRPGPPHSEIPSAPRKAAP